MWLDNWHTIAELEEKESSTSFNLYFHLYIIKSKKNRNKAPNKHRSACTHWSISSQKQLKQLLGEFQRRYWTLNSILRCERDKLKDKTFENLQIYDLFARTEYHLGKPWRLRTNIILIRARRNILYAETRSSLHQ